MTHTILTTVVQNMLWSLQAMSASAHALSMSAKGTVTAMGAVVSKFMLSRAPKTLIVNVIWQARTFSAATLLGLVTIFVIYYSRSPWRKLPPGPRGLPIIGNALQVTDVHWLISKDCKERFGEYPLLYSGA